MKSLIAFVGRFAAQDSGQDLIEYGMLVALIAIVALYSVTTLGTTINAVFWAPIASNL
jgi:Flp pilus assembly pilin Flp